MSLSDIVKETNKLANNSVELVVITGGEPFRQPLELLCSELLKENFQVQIETNGTIFREIPKEVEIICSPKNTGNGYHEIRPDLLERVTAFKFIISANSSDYNIVPEVGQNKFNIPVYVQPMDEKDSKKNNENLQFCINLVLENNYILSLQQHKLIGVA